MKVIDKIESAIEKGKPFYSFEFFPPKTEIGLFNLYRRVDRMATLHPLFVDVTWGAGGTTSDLTLEIASNLQKYLGLDVVMHLTCTNMPIAKLDDTLEKAYDLGLQNILALRGDPLHQYRSASVPAPQKPDHQRQW